MDLTKENKTVSANKTRYCAITNCREQQLNKMQFQFLFCIEFVAYFPFDVDLVLFVDATAAAVAVFLPFAAAVAIGMACFCPIQKNS